MTLKVNSIFFFNFDTLESGIDLGQGINVVPGKFVKKNKCRALNKHRAWTKCAKLCWETNSKLENIRRQWFFSHSHIRLPILFVKFFLPYGYSFFQIFHALRLFKALRLFFLPNLPGPTLIPCPTSITDSRVFMCLMKSPKIFFLNSRFENRRAGFLLRWQNSLR